MYDKITLKQIVGKFFLALQQDEGAQVLGNIANMFDSTVKTEQYGWLGAVPQFREWVGGRNKKAPAEYSMSITNKKYEVTEGFTNDDLRRDKTGQIDIRIAELAQRTNAHWLKLIMQLLVDGDTDTYGTAYDGQYFFDTDHSEGSSGTQDNDISIDISALPVTNHGTSTSPSAGELELVILRCIQQMMGFVDDVGEPMNEMARNFTVCVPVAYMAAAQAATGSPLIDSTRTNTIMTMSRDGFNINLFVSPRIDWTTQLAVLRTDSAVKPFIRQEESGIEVKTLGPGSDHEFKEDEQLFGVQSVRAAGYGRWQYACMATMT
jgi:phage major head subunit gpT-like protein